jgi:hypothetical protein
VQNNSKQLSIGYEDTDSLCYNICVGMWSICYSCYKEKIAMKKKCGTRIEIGYVDNETKILGVVKQ